MRTWLLGICIASLLSAIAAALTKKSASHTAVRFAGGICILMAVLWPLRTWHLPQGNIPALSTSAPESNDTVLRSELARSSGETLEANALEQGILCSADVELDDTLLPCAVTLHTSPENQGTLRQLATAVLGLSAEQIRFETEERP